MTGESMNIEIRDVDGKQTKKTAKNCFFPNYTPICGVSDFDCERSEK